VMYNMHISSIANIKILHAKKASASMYRHSLTLDICLSMMCLVLLSPTLVQQRLRNPLTTHTAHNHQHYA
jgi:hypothetical protein